MSKRGAGPFIGTRKPDHRRHSNSTGHGGQQGSYVRFTADFKMAAKGKGDRDGGIGQTCRMSVLPVRVFHPKTAPKNCLAMG